MGSENCKRKHCNNLNHIYNHFQLIYTRTYLFGLCQGKIYLDKYTRTYLHGLCQGQIYLDNSNPFLFDYLLNFILTVVPLIRA